MKIQFVQYPKCGTCQKAAKWLSDNHVVVESRSIVAQKPSKNELEEWISKSGQPIAKFFNTSGKLYKENNVKDKVKIASDDELLTILASDGMMVKRPILLMGDAVLVGFKQDEWEKLLLSEGK